MSPDKLIIFKQIVSASKNNVLVSRKQRKIFANKLSIACGLWEPSVISFVEEMAGLSFRNADDRQLFIQFAELGL